MKHHLCKLLLLSQAMSASVLHATSVDVVSGASIPLVGIPSTLRPQVQGGSSVLIWSNTDNFNVTDCSSFSGVIGFANAGSVPAPAGSPRTGGTGFVEKWTACGTEMLYASEAEAQAAGESVARAYASHELPYASMAIDDTTGTIQSIRPYGVLLAGGVRISGTLTGGSMQVSNLRVDLINKTVTADLTGTRSAVNATTPAISYNSPNTVLWTFTTVDGPAALNPTDLLLSRSARDASLTAQGYTILSDGSVQATHRITALQITPEGATFTKNALGLQATGANALDTINGTTRKYGELEITTRLQLPTSQQIAAATGQTVATPYTLPNGVALRVTPLSISSALDLTPLVYDPNAPALSVQGLLGWFNAFSVNPSSYAGGLGSSTAVQDPRFLPDQFEGQTRTRIRLTSAGNSVTFNDQSGAVSLLGGFRHDMVGDFVNSSLGGGRLSAQNVVYNLSSMSVTADLTGSQGPIGVLASQPVVSRSGESVWTYTALNGPSTLPLQALASASSVTALPGVLQTAGYTINSVTGSAITFTGTYRFTGLMASPGLKDYVCLSLACTPQVRRALMGADTDYIGQFTASVRWSLPLSP